MRALTIVVGIGVVALVGCAPATGAGAPGGVKSSSRQARAAELCSTIGSAFVQQYSERGEFQVVAAHATTPEAYEEWQRVPEKRTESVAPAPENAPLAALCYFDGPFEVAVPHPPSVDVPPTDRIGVVVMEESGEAALQSAGSRANIDAEHDRPPIE